MGDGAAKFDFEPNILTIEHVLPQTVRAGSEWEKLWPDTAMRERWGNRIANLVPLTRKKNSEAQNYDFEKKKEIYFKGKSGTPYDESVERDGKIGEFNINDESTYGALKVGSLAFELFKKVLETGNITDEEIEKLKGKGYLLYYAMVCRQ